MNLQDYIRLAFKNLGRQKLRSALTIFAVVIGSTSVTIMLALVTGAKSFVTEQFEASGALQQVVITKQTDLDYDSARHGGGGGRDGIVLTDAIAAQVAAVPNVVAVSPQTSVYSLEALIFNGKKLTLQNTQAYEPNAAVKKTVVAGRDLSGDDAQGAILVSSAYADKLGFKGNYAGLIGQTVQLHTQEGYSGLGSAPPQVPQMQTSPNPEGNKPQMTPAVDLPAQVVGITGGDDDAAVFMSLKWAKGILSTSRYDQTPADREAMAKAQQAQQDQMNRPGKGNVGPPPAIQPTYTLITESQLDQNGYGSILAKVDATSHAEAVAANVRTMGLGAATAKSFVAQQLQILNIVGLVLGGIGGIALLVAAIGVVNTMVMAILERTREIGVMRACGATRAAVRRLFTFEASMLGFWGGGIGLLIGFGLTRVANVAINEQLKGNNIAASNIVSLPLWLIGAVLVITTLIGMLSGLYPASRAARLNPVEALRFE